MGNPTTLGAAVVYPGLVVVRQMCQYGVAVRVVLAQVRPELLTAAMEQQGVAVRVVWVVVHPVPVVR